jgi:hypothetical protein
MRNRAFRPIAAIVSILLLTGVPAQAGPVVISQVVQVMNSYQNPPDLRLRNVSQNQNSLASGVKGSVRPNTVDNSSDSGSVDVSDSSLGAPVTNSSDTLLSGVTLESDPQQIGVDIIDTGDIEGTVCDCGEITVPGGGFPKWPLLFLAAIPLFFIHGCDDCETPSPTPTPTPPGEIPEPASLLLFGSGLAAVGAGLRRRYSRAKLSAQIAAAEEE